MTCASLSTDSEPAAAEHMAARLSALSHPARIEIVRRLSASGCCCCKDVVGSLDLAQSTVSQHLKVLVAAGLVRYAQHGQRSLYEVDRAALAELLHSLSGLVDACRAGGRSAGQADAD